MSASDGHTVAPEGEFESFGAYDSCQHCRQPIRWANVIQAWVTMIGANRECYRRPD